MEELLNEIRSWSWKDEANLNVYLYAADKMYIYGFSAPDILAVLADCLQAGKNEA